MDRLCKWFSTLCRMLALVLVILVCVACGQKGPLFLPETTTQQEVGLIR